MDADHGSRRKKRRSFVGGIYNRILDLILSVILSSHVGQFVTSDGREYKKSAVYSFSERGRSRFMPRIFEGISLFFSKSRVVSFFKGMTEAVMSMSVNVFGMFFTSYGVASALVQYAMMFLNSGSDGVLRRLVYAVLIVIVSVPFLTTSRSLTEMISRSVFAGRAVRSFLMIPDESLVPKKRIGSSTHMIISSLLGLLLGAVTYYIHPLAVPAVFLGLLLFLVIMSSPESGVTIISLVLPFLLYVERLKPLLCVLVCVTCVSYFFKSCGGKRVRQRSVEGMILFFFCMLLLIPSCFSSGGIGSFIEAVYTVILLFGAFYITYNLMRTEEKLRVCMRCITVSFMVLVAMGIWDVVYNGGFGSVIETSLGELGATVSDGRFYIYRGATGLGIIACFVCPILFCDSFAKKSISGIAVSLLGFAASVAIAVVYCSYEALAAIAIGLLIYAVFHSRKSFAALLTAAVAVGICVTLVMTFVPSAYIDKANGIIEDLKPQNTSSDVLDDGVDSCVWDMISDGRLGGIGVGEEVFKEEFSDYAPNSASDVSAPENMYLQIICWSGIGGFTVFIIFIAYVVKNTLGYMLTSTEKRIRRTVLALSCGCLSVLILGMITNIWSDDRMFYLFWLMMGLLCGFVRVGRVREEEKQLVYESEADRTDISMSFYG